MKLIIDVPDFSMEDLPGLIEDSEHDNFMQRATIEWLGPMDGKDAGSSRVHRHRITLIARQPGQETWYGIPVKDETRQSASVS